MRKMMLTAVLATLAVVIGITTVAIAKHRPSDWIDAYVFGSNTSLVTNSSFEDCNYYDNVSWTSTGYLTLSGECDPPYAHVVATYTFYPDGGGRGRTVNFETDADEYGDWSMLVGGSVGGVLLTGAGNYDMWLHMDNEPISSYRYFKGILTPHP